MPIPVRTLLLTGLLTALALQANAVLAAPLTLTDYLALRGPAPTAHLAYGSAPSQFVELFRPVGEGPFPVVLLVHGGCWTIKHGGIEQMRSMAGELAAHGIAVWNMEYRRADEAGGGYPGTYLDLNAAIDKLVSEARRYQLDTGRVVAVGHSAGGHLAQWKGGRGKVAPGSVLFQATQLAVPQVISLGGLADLRHEKALIRSSCGREVAELTGAASPARPDVFADTNPADLIPNGSKTVLVTGALDTISPPRVALDYAARARRAGDRADTVILPDASHFDEVAVASPSWKLIFPLIEQALSIGTAPATGTSATGMSATGTSATGMSATGTSATGMSATGKSIMLPEQ
ncbi:MAG: alpha/beta hydrolase [Pseudomonadota bacterium]